MPYFVSCVKHNDAAGHLLTRGAFISARIHSLGKLEQPYFPPHRIAQSSPAHIDAFQNIAETVRELKQFLNGVVVAGEKK